MNKISYSQLSLYDQCPQHWKLRYVDKISKTESNIYLIFGTAMHEVLQMYLEIMYNDSIKKADALPLSSMLLHRMKHYYTRIVEDLHGEEISSKEEMQEFYQHGLAIIEWFVKKRSMYFSKRGYELIGVEVPINYNGRTVEEGKKIKFYNIFSVIIEIIKNKFL